MEKKDAAEVSHVCFLALSRPTLVLGVPVSVFLAILSMSMGAMLLLSPYYGLVGGLLFMGAREVVRRDSNNFSLLSAWFGLWLRQGNKTYWGGASVSPSSSSISYRKGGYHV